MRPSGREPDQLRPVIFTPDYTKHAEGSVLVEFGDTRVLCTASVESRVPPWMRGAGTGWVTGEYGMLRVVGRKNYRPQLIRFTAAWTHRRLLFFV